VACASDTQPARHRLCLELWSWSAWLVLGVISYPAVLLIWIAPRAGLLSGLIAGLLVVYAATLGYSRRRDLERWFLPTLMSAFAAVVVGAIAFALDKVAPRTAVLCGLILGAETVFIWHFLPWLVHDADSPEAAPASIFQPFSAPTRGRAPVRASLSVVLLLALLALGLGAVWSRAETRIPGPAAWVIALGVLALAFMFVERLVYLERSAREGNLLMVAGSYRRWLATALLTLALIGGLVAIVPLLQAKARREAERAGTRMSDTPASAFGRRLNSAADRALGAMSQAGAAPKSLPRGLFPLLLLLLLLLLALLFIYLLRRTHAVRRLLRAVAWLTSLSMRAWNRIRAWAERFKRPRQTTSAAAPPPDPLLNIFEDPRGLEGLSAREVIIRTYHLLLNFAEMLGQGRRQGQTPFEYARSLSPAAPEASESLLALTWAYSAVMYGGAAVSLPDISAVHHSWQRVSSALTANLTIEELDLRRRAYLAARQLDSSMRP
jgi:hypothetical protein